MRVGIVPRGSPPGTHVMDRWRYDVLIAQSPRYGVDAEYRREGETYDLLVVPLFLENAELLHATSVPAVGDITDDHFAFPWRRFNAPGRLAHLVNRVLTQKPRRLAAMVARCEAVVTGSVLQAARYRRHCPTVHAITDSISCPRSLATHRPRQEQDPIRLIWIGNVESLHGLASIQGVLDELAATGRFELLLITSASTRLNRFWRRPRSATQFIARQRMACRLLHWTIDDAAEQLSHGDIGLLPIDAAGAFTYHKPAGRALLMMASGVPVVATPIPSFREAIRHGENGMLADSPEAWVRSVTSLADSRELRQSMGRTGHTWALERYGADAFAARYFDVIKNLTSRPRAIRVATGNAEPVGA